MSRRLPEIVALLAIAFGSYLRLADLPSLLLFGDEYHGLPLSRQGYGVILSSFDANGSGIALPFLQRLCLDVFGVSQWAYRLPAVAGGIAGLVAMYPVSRRIVGRSAAAIATLALAANPLHVFYSHFSRSYSIAVFGCLVLVYASYRVSAEPPSESPGSKRWLLSIAVSAALIPWVHLSALGLVASVGLGAVFLMWLEGRSRRDLSKLVASFGAAALLCLALYLPAWQPFWAFYRLMTPATNAFDFGAVAVTSLMFGSPAAAVAYLLGVPLAAAWMFRARRGSALLLIPAALAPIALLLVQHPYGSEVAYAHYLLTSIPFMLMLMSWAIVRAAGALMASPESADVAAVAVGALLVALAFWGGPLGREHTDAGPFANSYLSQRSDPGFDVPFDATPDFYASLAAEGAELRIIEAPALVNLAMLLYRNYYLQHGKQVLLGFFNKRFGVTGPYVSLLDPGQLRDSGADYLVFHRDARAEVRRYWRFAQPGSESTSLVRVPSPRQVLRLRRILGPPTLESDSLLVWKLPTAGGAD